MSDKKHTSISSHCLDTATGKPAGGLRSTLQIEENGQWKTLAEHNTNGNSLTVFAYLQMTEE